MSSAARSRAAQKNRLVVYDGFRGIDSSRDQASMDTQKEQHLVEVNNAYCDWRGQIVKDPNATVRHQGGLIQHIRFFAVGEAAWAEKTGAGINLNSDRGHILENAYPNSASISSTVFNRRLITVSKDQPSYTYNGVIWAPVTGPLSNSLKPAHICSVQRRAVVSGMKGRETEVHLSRVDVEEVFPDNEDAASENVLRAGSIDVANLVGTAEEITGIAPFESNRLALFTSDRTLLYNISPNIDEWAIDQQANIRIGTISHNSIVQAGTDVLFCSRSGIHTIRRSDQNGILVTSLSLSDKVDSLYRAYLKTVEDITQVSAVFDRDNTLLHVFFPQPGDVYCKRLTLALNVEGGEPIHSWSTGTFLNARCADFLAGVLTFGTNDGTYDIQPHGEPGDVSAEATIVTPILWHGSMTLTKETTSLLIQATGEGNLIVEARDENGNLFHSDNIEITDSPDDNNFPDVPLYRQFERRFEHRYRGVQFTFRLTGSGLVRLMGFAITTRKD